MFTDGRLSDRDIVERGFRSPNTPYTIKVAIRGRYTDDDEPTVAPIVFNPGLAPTPDPTDNGDDILTQSQSDSILPQWPAVRAGDVLYLACMVRKLPVNDKLPKEPGSLAFRLPTDAFEFDELVFPVDILRNLNVMTDEGDDTYPGGTVYRWEVDNSQIDSILTFFVKIRVKSTAINNDNHYLYLDWRTLSGVSGSAPGTIYISKDGVPTLNPDYFSHTTATCITISYARDPNSISVLPEVIPPTSTSAVPPPLTCRVDIENLSTSAFARNLDADVELDPRIDPASLSQIDYHFPNAPGTFSAVHSTSGSMVKWVFTDVNIANITSTQSNKAYFTFQVKVRPNVVLKEGDRLPFGLTVRMRGGRTVDQPEGAVEDSFTAAPDTVLVTNGGRSSFGCVFGVKGHTHLRNSDKLENGGLALMMRFPLINPRGNRLQDRYLRNLPRLFWQVELGWGKGTINAPENAGRGAFSYIHLTPLQLRYMQPFKLGSYWRHIGLSAGFSLGYIYDATLNGLAFTLPSGFGKRLENEFAVSLDVMSAVGVPGVTAGIGYKFRNNRLYGKSVSYSFPFVYAQVDFFQINRRYCKIWNKVYPR